MSGVAREELHLRRVECRGFRRTDGLFDVEGRIVDTKTYPYPSSARGLLPIGEPLHDMMLKLTFDEDLLVHDAAATMDSTPYKICPGATGIVSCLIGTRMRSGWLAEIRKKWTAQERCTHLFEMLTPMATVAFQTLSVIRQQRDSNPARINSCYAYSTDREIVKERWPDSYTGER